MQTTSALYKQLIALDPHWFEAKLVIDTVGTFSESQLFSIRTEHQMFQGLPEIGKAIASEIGIKMLMPEDAIPTMAVLRPYVRVCAYVSGVETQSEWLPQGVFFVDTREVTHNNNGLDVLMLHGYDAMLKAEQDYPNTNHAWPYLDTAVVAEIATTIGVSVDSRVAGYLTSGYMVNLPTGYSMREVLENIAAAYAGSFVMTPDGKLTFVPIYGNDPDITGNYLADEDGNALVLGNEGWCILV